MADRVVWKYQLQLNDDDQPVEMPIRGSSDALHVGAQNGRPTLWAEVEPTNEYDTYHFRVFGTGHPIPHGYRYVGTTQIPPFVWHIYEKWTT